MIRARLEQLTNSLRATARFARGRRRHACTLVAVARDEGPYIAEWLAFHLAIGFERILVFDHGSADETGAIVRRAAMRTQAVSLHAVPEAHGGSPQIAAYAAALPFVRTPWVAFFDIDEFLVPWRDGSVQAFIARVPDDVSAVHINWRSFGSSGLTEPGYDLVTEAFVRCAEADWQYQAHYKTLARTAQIRQVNIHELETRTGRRTLSDFTDVAPGTIGSADRIVYDGIQLNHYQAKTRSEFDRRMRHPRADAPNVSRMADRDLRWQLLDRNEVEDRSIRRFQPMLRAKLKQMTG
ncbi:glycosyltransferase family 2 protein [Methylobacterium sp. J-030]|uniref:glycosyltransferase family 2 protein n=1 Tax=Methylobacterium sp. J-030 TaxID=2836627 RepID=UPI001FB936FE|nr:glycosyltransferase family 2 protein [Methylobacterium sp. J-030]MCJ2073127.1 glycosyltransferase family 2 protein [Methylobacterium sp. J-030]